MEGLFGESYGGLIWQDVQGSAGEFVGLVWRILRALMQSFECLRDFGVLVRKFGGRRTLRERMQGREKERASECVCVCVCVTKSLSVRASGRLT